MAGLPVRCAPAQAEAHEDREGDAGGEVGKHLNHVKRHRDAVVLVGFVRPRRGRAIGSPFAVAEEEAGRGGSGCPVRSPKRQGRVGRGQGGEDFGPCIT